MYDSDYPDGYPLCIYEGENDLVNTKAYIYNREYYWKDKLLNTECEDVSKYHTDDWLFDFIPF